MSATHSTIDVHGIDAHVIGDREGIELDQATLVNPRALIQWAAEGMDHTDLLEAKRIIDAAVEESNKTAGNPGTGEQT